MLGRSRKKYDPIVAAIDVGTYKATCLIADISSPNQIDILGVGHQLSEGMRAGAIVDMDGVETSIVNAVHQAEQMARETIKTAYININGLHLHSQHVRLSTDVSGHVIDDRDIKRLLSEVSQRQRDPKHHVMHTIPIGYHLDGQQGIQDPRGMFGGRLDMILHLVSGLGSARQTLKHCLSRCHLEMSGCVATPFASGLATLVEDEMNLGVTVVDMGAGTTSYSVFHEGRFLNMGVLGVGGMHVTSDIARAFSTSLSHAERLKTLYGSAMVGASDHRDMVMIPQMGEGRGEGMTQVPRSSLVSVIKPRMEEIFEMLRAKLSDPAIRPFVGNRVVLTGGASQLAGVRELASLVLQKNVRLGKPIHLGAMDGADNPGLSTCSGILSYVQAGVHEVNMPANHQNDSTLGRVKGFLKAIW